MPAACGGDSAPGAAPTHHHGAGSQLSVENLVPADQPAALGFEVTADAEGQVGLQSGFVLDPFVLHAGPAVGALLPTYAGTLVAADVDELRREEFQHFVQHAFEKFEGLLFVRAENIVEDAPASARLETFRAVAAR